MRWPPRGSRSAWWPGTPGPDRRVRGGWRPAGPRGHGRGGRDGRERAEPGGRGDRVRAGWSGPARGQRGRHRRYRQPDQRRTGRVHRDLRAQRRACGGADPAGLPHLRQAGGGAVVIVSSITGLRPAPRTAYAAAKAAEIQLAATAAQELAPDRIRVNAVSPGSIIFPGGSWDSFQQDNPGDFATFSPPSSRSAGWEACPRSRTSSRSCSAPAGVVGDGLERRGGWRPALPERPPLRLSGAAGQPVVAERGVPGCPRRASGPATAVSARAPGRPGCRRSR